MKYFADYMNESIYAIDENSGDGVMVNARDRSVQIEQQRFSV